MLLGSAAQAIAAPPAFPGAEGFGAVATGGRGGQVFYVTTLDPDPGGVVPGSLNYALNQTGPRYILFKVSGVIHGIAQVKHGDVTIAGQTSPGGIIVRGLVCDGHYEMNDCSNIIARHLRLRPGWDETLPPGGERLDDGLRLDGLSHFIFDHVSIAHATDEEVQLSWASQGTIQRSMFSETIGSHFLYGGMLLNYSIAEHPQTQLSVLKNIWYRIGGRLPEITCEASGFQDQNESTADCQAHALELEVSNNLYFDPGYMVWYNRYVNQDSGLGPYRLHLNLVGNQMIVRDSFPYGFALHDMLDEGSNQLYASGNHMSRYPAYADYELFYCCNDFPTNAPNNDLGSATRLGARQAFGTVSYISAGSLQANLLASNGAWPRDPMDRRIHDNIASGVIDPTNYDTPLAHDSFNLDFPAGSPPPAPIDSDNDGMPDGFEAKYAALGLNPAVADANGSVLSVPLTGVAGYTNLEVYLNRLADQRVDTIFADGFE